MNSWKENLEETKRHYVDWWNGRGIVLNMWEHFQNGVAPHADVPMPPAPKSLDQKWFDPKWRADYLDWYVAHSCLKADMLPVANTQLGPGSLAAILGGVFEGGEDTIWIHPDPNYTDDIKFDPENPAYLLHKELLRAVKAKAQGHYFTGMPDLMEGLDVLAAIKGTDKVLLDTVMQPEVLEQQMQAINDIYFRVYDELYDIIKEDNGEMAFCYFSSWAPGRMSKLQSDISTMISEADYLRFVQPFIRQQCQKIDYTLYHLDGVGALHHLPAILDIKELNAIQWTPGVGEPQGGSPKWYDLYRRMLAAGKSVMACWVTLDELRPLLDNIGGDGVHLEMDFHNEDEVEQAMRIVEEYRGSSAAPKAPDETLRLRDDFDADREVERIIEEVEGSGAMPFKAAESPIAAAMRGRILVLDGAMGTMIQRSALSEQDFRGDRFASHPCELMGDNDLLNITRPELVEEITRKYLDAGVSVVTTNTFNSQRVSQADFRMEDHAAEMNAAGCRIARRLADEYTAANPALPRFVAGSVGPTPRTLSMASATTQPGVATFSRELLYSAYREQAEALIEGGVDALLIETIFDVENARVAVEAAADAMKALSRSVPLMLSFNVGNSSGSNMLGQNIKGFIESLDHKELILSVGLNCVRDVAAVTPLLEELAGSLPYFITIYPNAGMPDQNGHYSLSPRDFAASLWGLMQYHRLNAVGGCCGTTPDHVKALAVLSEPLQGCVITPHVPGDKGNAVVPAPMAQAPAPKSVPERAEECECCHPRPAEVKKQSAAERIFEGIVEGNADKTREATEEAIGQKMAPQDIINGQMIRAMGEVGQRFQDGKAFVPQLLMAGRAMKGALELLKPLLAGEASTSVGKVVIGTVKGDLHDIGKNLVASMLEGCGFEVVNIGIDVPSDKFIEAVREHRPDILCMSALLTTTMTYMKTVIHDLEKAGLRDRVKIMVGGAPVSRQFANEIGADAYSDNANSAVRVAKEILGKA